MKMNDLRAKLLNAIDEVQSGNLEATEAKSIVGLANQVSQSINVEIKSMQMQRDLGRKIDKLGDMKIC
jgi:hypothetical protein|tara:strand:+ start:161 stop:364 length:204 start_codon:yes stop_codon:yes gene_type:complete